MAANQAFEKALSRKGHGYRDAMNYLMMADISLQSAGHNRNHNLRKKAKALEAEFRKLWDKEYRKANEKLTDEAKAE